MARKIDIRAYALTELHYDDFYNSFKGWTFRDFQRDPQAFHGWIAFTTVMYCPLDGFVHCGLTRFDNDILYVFEPGSNRFRSLGYNQVAEKFEVKIHRSLVLSTDGWIYGATALLHDINDAGDAPGGKLFRYRPGGEGKFEVLGVPVPHAYIQSIALDERRMTLYGFTFMPEYMFSYDINSGESKNLGLIGSCLFIGQAHRPVLDDEGRVWGTWGSYYSENCLPTEGHRICLMSYHPENDAGIQFLQHGLEGEGVSSTDMVDEAVNGGDGFIYFGGRSGKLYCLDPKTAKCECLSKPDYYLKRISGMVATEDGLLYLAAGDKDCARVFIYDRKDGKFSDLGPVYDSERGEFAEKIHCLTIDKKRRVLYGGEIDNVRRSSYLWEIKIN